MLEDWATLSYFGVEARGKIAMIYFLILVFIGTLFVLNLVLATLADGFTRTLDDVRE